MLFTFLSKYKQSLSQIVQDYKKTHACQHRQVSLYFFIKSAEYPGYYRFCHTVGYQVAHRNIYNKRQYLFPGFFFVLESKIFNQLPRCKHSSTVLGSYVAAHSTCLSLLLPQARKRGMRICLSLLLHIIE